VVFFFQAEDGIRDIGVTGVQTCALPISLLYLITSRVYTSAGNAQEQAGTVRAGPILFCQINRGRARNMP